MKSTLIITLISYFIVIESVYAQVTQEEDILIDSLCLSLTKNKFLDDSLNLELAFAKFYDPYIAKIKSTDVEKVSDRIYYRFQNRCEIFREIIDHMSENNSEKDDWTRIYEDPSPSISEIDLKEFKSRNEFYYLDKDSTITRINIVGKYWADYYNDDTYSKLEFEWLNNYEFQLTFIYSNNEIRKSLQHKGEKSKYKVISAEKGFYWIVLYNSNYDRMTKFKLRY